MIELEHGAPMRAYQDYIHELEAAKGWLDVDLVHNCFLMGEEVGELFKAVRKVNRLFDQADAPPADRESLVADVGEELVDVLNYLLAIANRLDIDVEQAFRAKNERNQGRTWG
ncbi:MAG: NTP pyrophosphatase (non-canonical NTP hydrolase) [Myxococcota bacterium]